MSKAISDGQALSLTASFAVDTPWKEINSADVQPFIELPPKERGERFASFLKSGGGIFAKGSGSKIIPIDRTTSFNPAGFLGKGWTIVEEDERSLSLAEVDLNKVHLETVVKKEEGSITGAERFRRLREGGHIRLDAKVFQTLWENQSLIPEEWKGKIRWGSQFVCFDGTVLQNPNGGRCVLCLLWFGGRWLWDDKWLGGVWGADNPSAVLVV
ncbi:MAG: hypothetical protein WC609_01770 [Candidatus Paceibacterota bacterium]|jgi:hypothetical protein